MENISGTSVSWSMAKVVLEGNKTSKIKVLRNEVCKISRGEKHLKLSKILIDIGIL
jgi:hypothetical protein